MVNVAFHPHFEELFLKIKDKYTKIKLRKQISKIVNFPLVGKPMKYLRKGTREVYVKPFRLSYVYLADENKVIFQDIYHKDDQ